MLIRFQTEWYAETSKWVDASIKIAAAESAENKAAGLGLDQGLARPGIKAALTPLAQLALGDAGRIASWKKSSNNSMPAPPRLGLDAC